jgi:hypothetical protein
MAQLPPTAMADLATKGDLGALEGRLEERMHRLVRSMDPFDARLHGFHQALRAQTRSFILASTTSMATLAAVAFAAARLF